MTRATAGAAALVGLLAAFAPAAHARTFIAAIASNGGLASEAPLRFAEADARAILAVLAEVHPDPDRVTELVLAATPARTRALLDRWAATITRDDAVIVFLTGHGDARGAHLGDTILPWTELDQRLLALGAAVTIAIVDTCQSGALLGPKGFVRGAPIRVKLEPRGPRGRWYLSSSGADELSHESARLGGSPFAHHLVSALRGAADEDGDRAVTMSEVYRHIYARTIASTLAAPQGPQRPAQSVDLVGAGELVLAAVAGARVHGSSERACWILDAAEERVLAELAGPRPISLPPGRYVVTCARDDHAVARAELELVDEAHLDRLVFRSAPLTYALAKGGGPAWSFGAHAGAVMRAGTAVAPSAGLVLGASWAGDTVVLPLQVILHFDGDAARPLLLAGAGHRLPWWRLGRLDLGLELGASLESGSLGQFARWELPVGPIALSARADLLTVWTPDRESAITLEVLLSAGLSLPIFDAPGNSPGEEPTR